MANDCDGARSINEAHMDWKQRITVDPGVLAGKPVIKGTRIAVESVVDLLGRGWTPEQILREYDHLSPADIQACLAYASDALKSERVYLLPLEGSAMRYLTNENVSGTVIQELRRLEHDVLSVKESMRGERDLAILQRAQVEQRLVITHDKDFGELAFRSQQPASCGIILFRLSGPDPDTATAG